MPELRCSPWLRFSSTMLLMTPPRLNEAAKGLAAGAFISSGMRLAEVTACVVTFRSARPVAFFTSSTILPQISQPKPVGWALSSR